MIKVQVLLKEKCFYIVRGPDDLAHSERRVRFDFKGECAETWAYIKERVGFKHVYHPPGEDVD